METYGSKFQVIILNKKEDSKITDEERKEIEEIVSNFFIPRGKECGEKIAEVLRERGHEKVVPLYRSAIVLEGKMDGDKAPYLSITFYEDPHFWGAEEISDETVRSEGHEYAITGSRSGMHIYDVAHHKITGRGEMMTKDMHKMMDDIEKMYSEGNDKIET
jgi:hypothetical protein